jgi:hypothetical protein
MGIRLEAEAFDAADFGDAFGAAFRAAVFFAAFLTLRALAAFVAAGFAFAAPARARFTPLDDPDFFVFGREAAFPVPLALRLAIVRVLSATLTVCDKCRTLYCLSEIRRRCQGTS